MHLHIAPIWPFYPTLFSCMSWPTKCCSSTQRVKSITFLKIKVINCSCYLKMQSFWSWIKSIHLHLNEYLKMSYTRRIQNWSITWHIYTNTFSSISAESAADLSHSPWNLLFGKNDVFEWRILRTKFPNIAKWKWISHKRTACWEVIPKSAVSFQPFYNTDKCSIHFHVNKYLEISHIRTTYI